MWESLALIIGLIRSRESRTTGISTLKPHKRLARVEPERSELGKPRPCFRFKEFYIEDSESVHTLAIGAGLSKTLRLALAHVFSASFPGEEKNLESVVQGSSKIRIYHTESNFYYRHDLS